MIKKTPPQGHRRRGQSSFCRVADYVKITLPCRSTDRRLEDELNTAAVGVGKDGCGSVRECGLVTFGTLGGKIRRGANAESGGSGQAKLPGVTVGSEPGLLNVRERCSEVRTVEVDC